MRNRKGLLTLAASTVILAGSILLGTIATGQGAAELARPVIITNTPLPVNIKNAPVPITNDGTNQLLVKTASTPVKIECFATFGPTFNNTSVDCYTVPAAQLLVIEQVSVSYQNAAHPLDMASFSTRSGFSGDVQTQVAFAAHDDGQFTGSHLVRDYGQEGTHLRAFASRGGGSGGSDPVFFSFAGYLVPFESTMIIGARP
jgi:hypothetical protein